MFYPNHAFSMKRPKELSRVKLFEGVPVKMVE
jgi:hypothetical protein